MASFQERKAARISAGNQAFKFDVEAGFPYGGEIVGSFTARKKAEDFAFKQISAFAGDTQANRALNERHKDAQFLTVSFSIRRSAAA